MWKTGGGGWRSSFRLPLSATKHSKSSLILWPLLGVKVGGWLVTVTLVITVLITMFVSMLMVAIASVLVFRAAHAKRLLDGHFLSAELHRVHQVIDDGHGPHRGRVPGLHVAIFPHQQHGEVFRADLEIVPHVLYQGGRQPFTFHGGSPWMKKELMLEMMEKLLSQSREHSHVFSFVV